MAVLELSPVDRALDRVAEGRVPSAAEVIKHIKAYQALGVSHFVFDLAPPDLRGQLSLMERFAEEVRPKVLRAPR